MPGLILPIITYDPAIDYNQYKLIKNLERYLAAKQPTSKLIFDSENGLCSGLAAYWLYSKRIGEEGRFLHNLEYATQWDEEKFKAQFKQGDPTTHQDLKLEEFLNNVLFLQHDKSLRDGITQDNLPASFNLLLNDYYPQVNAAEFKMLFAFNYNTLLNLIKDTVFQNKMVRFDNALHTIALMYSGNKYYLYDANSPKGPESYSPEELDKLVKQIFASFGKISGPQHYISLHMVAFDITEDAIIAKYPESISYCKALLDDPYDQQAILTDVNIFHLCIRYRAYKILDLLFAAGYKYIPWQITQLTEFEEAIIYEDYEKLKYLLMHKIPIDYRTQKGITPLARAVINNKVYMMYELLKAGADPNIEAEEGMSVFHYAVIKDDPAYVILLLAAGFNLTKFYRDQLVYKYPQASDMKAIVIHALLLHAKFMPKDRKIAPELVAMFDKIVNTIRKKSIEEYDAATKQEIDEIVATIDELVDLDSDLQKHIQKVKTKIDTYVGGAYTRKHLFFSSKNSTLEQDVSYEHDILPLLSLTQRLVL